MLKVLILAAQNNVSDSRMDHLIRDRLSWLSLPRVTASLGRCLRSGYKSSIACSRAFGLPQPGHEKWLKRMGRISRILRRKSPGRPMPERTARANAAKSKVRVRVELVVAHQKHKMGLFIRHHRPTPRRGQDHARQPCLR
jgi:hypothetical protein